MVRSISVRKLVTVQDLSVEDIMLILKLAEHYKLHVKSSTMYDKPLTGRIVGLYFELPSTRTRLAFGVATFILGGNVIYLRKDELQLKRGETLEDTIRILSRMLNALVVRVLDHDRLLKIAEYSEIPVINGLTRMYHPTQALTDIFTIREFKGFRRDIKIAYVGDGYNNVCHSLLLACSKVGLNITVACPIGYEPDRKVVKMAEENSEISNCVVDIVHDPIEAVRNADVIYTDVYVSMGTEKEREKRLRDFEGWTITKELLKHAKKDYIFMHCLPAHRGEEVASDILDDPKHSVVWVQAENKLYIAMSLLTLLL